MDDTTDKLSDFAALLLDYQAGTVNSSGTTREQRKVDAIQATLGVVWTEFHRRFPDVQPKADNRFRSIESAVPHHDPAKVLP